MKPRVTKVYGWFSCIGRFGKDTVCATGDTPLRAIKNFETCARQRGFL